jgi:hypothetical protein
VLSVAVERHVEVRWSRAYIRLSKGGVDLVGKTVSVKHRPWYITVFMSPDRPGVYSLLGE